MNRAITKTYILQLAPHVMLITCVLVCLFVGGNLASLPIELRVRGQFAHLLIDGNDVRLDTDAAFSAKLLLNQSDPLKHEIQIDGTDSINNGTYDPDYFQQFSQTLYYKLEDWMRNGSLYDHWHDYTLIDTDTKMIIAHSTEPLLNYPVAIQNPKSNNYDVQVFLEYPEAPAEMRLITSRGTTYTVQIDRNDRLLQVDKLSSNGGSATTLFKGYFPTNPWPFLGEILLSFAHILLAAWVIVLFCLLFGLVIARLTHNISIAFINIPRLENVKTAFIANRWIVYGILASSLGFTLFIAFYDYHGQPHILDAVAYFFQAKIFALGRLNVPVPPAYQWVNGPFMVATGGRWFALFPPGTSLVLSLGMLAHVPWLVEPVLGTAALWGTYAIARQWYSSSTALLTLVLLALSPFYTFLAASYLSHTICLFFLVYMGYFLQSYCRDAVTTTRPHLRDLVLSACCLGAAFFTRELSAVVVGGILLVGIPFCHFWRKQGETGQLQKKQSISPTQLKIRMSALLLYLTILTGWFLLYLDYNGLQTGNPFLSPRLVFFPGDRYGFGQGIGFYGQHTVAAGLVNLDQLATSFQIELYGWPYLVTLACLVLPFLLRKANRWDWLCLLVGTMLFLSMIGWHYHSIAIGPRHLYEALPFYAILTARGIIVSASCLAEWTTRNIAGKSQIFSGKMRTSLAGWPVYLLIIVCIGCNLFYYMPRHIQVYHDYAGLPASYHLNVQEIYDNHLHHAVVVTNDWFLFNNVLASLNDPLEQGDVLFALVSTPEEEDIRRLEAYYPSRTFYRIMVLPNGVVQYIPIS